MIELALGEGANGSPQDFAVETVRGGEREMSYRSSAEGGYGIGASTDHVDASHADRPVTAFTTPVLAVNCLSREKHWSCSGEPRST
jgi:hypothetical protein